MFLKAAATLGLLASACSLPTWDQLEGYTFEEYTKDFQKSYASESHRQGSEEIFNRRLSSVIAHNSDSLQTYKRGVNHMSDWSQEELNSLRGHKKELSYLSRSKDAPVPLSSVVRSRMLKELPTSVDWREKGVVTPVKDQGRCGSCWTFAATETIESHWAIETGELHILSEQNILDCVDNVQQCGGTGGCAGGTAELAFGFFQTQAGIASEWTYPYDSYFGDDTKGCRFNETTTRPAARVTQYVKLPSNEYEPLMEAVATVGPIAISVDASVWHDYESGVFNGCDQASPELDHAVQLVGYGTDADLGDYWLVRNSWGPVWGESGYIRLKRNSTPVCGTDVAPLDGTACAANPEPQHVCGTCGILFDNAYPIVK